MTKNSELRHHSPSTFYSFGMSDGVSAFCIIFPGAIQTGSRHGRMKNHLSTRHPDPVNDLCDLASILMVIDVRWSTIRKKLRAWNKRESGNEWDRLFIRRSYVCYGDHTAGREVRRREDTTILHIGEYPQYPQMRPNLFCTRPQNEPI